MKLQVWCCTSMILALARGRQDGCEFYASLGKIARPYFEKANILHPHTHSSFPSVSSIFKP